MSDNNPAQASASSDRATSATRHFAHAKTGVAKDQWHALHAHLEGTALKASAFAERWGGGGLAFLAGLWHDLGKYAPDWQQFLAEAGQEAPVLGEEQAGELPRGRRRGPDHSTAGAIHAKEALGGGPAALALQFAIAAHHAGLSDYEDLRNRVTHDAKRDRYLASAREAPAAVLEPQTEAVTPEFITTSAPNNNAARRRFETFIRMSFSALVDADHLDTEQFFLGGPGVEENTLGRRRRWKGIDQYVSPLEEHLAALMARAEPSCVNQARREVLGWCREAAQDRQGVFTLTVPTGGGKTLASLMFALLHARHHGLDRVIIALPFLSILDQTADVLRRVFEPALGAPALLEHHSNIRPEHDTMLNRLATENWDAPVIVTTQVQFFESLFGAHPRECRKLHNLAKSVVVLDEVQTLPVGLLSPIIDQLQELVSHYGSSLLLTTATQPALHARQLGATLFNGFAPVPREIVPTAETDALFDILRRVRVEWPVSEAAVEWKDLAERLVQHEQVLAVVHRREDAAVLWQLVESLAPGAALHLSALMCPAHRRHVLQRIEQLLGAGQACRVIATQLVEAGVDVDFPVVYRALGGLESLAQAAGRCNREGRKPFGRFIVFIPPSEPPPSLIHHRDIARVMLAADPALDLMHPATFRSYFDRLYGHRSTDVHNIQRLRKDLKFASVAQEFRMIDDSGTTVFVPYGDAARRAIEDVRARGPSREGFRTIQPFGVSLYPKALRDMMVTGRIEIVHDSVHVLVAETDYDPQLGLRVEPNSFAPLIV